MSAHFLSSDISNILLRTPQMWSSLRGKSIFITGGTGFFGRWLLETLCAANKQYALGLSVTTLSRTPEAFGLLAPNIYTDPTFRFIRGDVRNFDFPEGRFTHVIHAATTSAQETFSGADPLSKFDTLIQGTRRVLDFAATHDIENFLFTSSGAVYQPLAQDDSQRSPGIRESSLLAPASTDTQSALGQAKRAAEFLCACYAEKHDWQLGIARCFSFVGPFLPLDIHYAIGNFIKQALDDDRIIVRSDGSALRSYLYAADLVTWLLTILLKKEAIQVYNVGSDESISIRDLAYLVRDLLAPGKAVEIQGQPAFGTGNPVRNTYIPDISLARTTLELDVWTKLPTAIKATARQAREQCLTKHF